MEKHDLIRHARGCNGHDSGEQEAFSNCGAHSTTRRASDTTDVSTPARKIIVNPRAKRNEDSAVAAICAWVVKHQIGLAINLLLLLALTHLCFPRSRRHTRKFFELSYYDPESKKFTLGWNDIFMVFYWIILFTGLRAGVMDFILLPLARWGGVGSKKGRIRFAEQAWLLLYYGVFWSLGMFIFYRSDYWLNTREMWTDWPNREMDGLFKWYYLVQFAFWLQQIVVVNIEERRKDYHQMFTHHVITCALIFASYGYHQTRVGNVILCLMDVVDIVLPMAKMLKYLHFQLACDIAFGIFMLTWFIARHVLYLMVCWSVYADIPDVIRYGCYSGKTGKIRGPFPAPNRFSHLWQPFRDPEGLVCWDNQIKWGFLTMLLALQVITLIWFGMIMRVAWRVVKGGTAEDSRSDDEGEDDEMMDESEPSPYQVGVSVPPLEEEVGVEAIHLRGRTSPSRRLRKGVGSASGVTLPGHSDRKELLGRIGCDKTA